MRARAMQTLAQGEFDSGRRKQRLAWLWAAVAELAVDAGRKLPASREVVEAVEAGTESPSAAANRIVQMLRSP